MKTLKTFIFTLVMSLSLLAVPAFAMANDGYTTKSNGINQPTNTYAPNDVTHQYKTNNVTNDRMNSYGVNANNYRTNAVNNDRNYNWSWLGLLGLAGLFGLRSRERERS